MQGRQWRLMGRILKVLTKESCERPPLAPSLKATMHLPYSVSHPPRPVEQKMMRERHRICTNLYTHLTSLHSLSDWAITSTHRSHDLFHPRIYTSVRRRVSHVQ